MQYRILPRATDALLHYAQSKMRCRFDVSLDSLFVSDSCAYRPATSCILQWLLPSKIDCCDRSFGKAKGNQNKQIPDPVSICIDRTQSLDQSVVSPGFWMSLPCCHSREAPHSSAPPNLSPGRRPDQRGSLQARPCQSDRRDIGRGEWSENNCDTKASRDHRRPRLLSHASAQ